MKIYCKIVNGQYKGRENSYPYRVCLCYEDVEVLNG